MNVQQLLAGPVRTGIPFHAQLRVRLLATLMFLAVVPVVLAQSITLMSTRSQTQQQVYNQLESVTDLKQHQIERWIGDAQLILQTLASSSSRPQMIRVLSTTPPDPTAQIMVGSFLRDESQLNLADTSASLRFNTFFLYDLQGQIVASSQRKEVGGKISQQPYFVHSLGVEYVQPPYRPTADSELSMVLTHPIYDETSHLVGVLAGELDLTTLGTIMLERSGLGSSGETYLVSVENNHLLTPSRFDGYTMTRPYHSFGIDEGLHQHDGMSQYNNYREPSVAVLGVYRWVPSLRSAILAEVEVGEALAAPLQSQRLSFLIAALTSLLAIGAGAYATSRISKPIVQLTQAAEHIAGGDLSYRLKLRHRDEFGLLSGTFNSMADQIQQSQADLERRVEERTGELQQALASLEQTLSELRDSTSAREQMGATMRAMSSPVVPVLDGILVMPLIGEIDSERSIGLIDGMLQAIESHTAQVVILDVTGVPVIDTQVARTLIDASQAAGLLGAQAVLVGLRPELAQTIVGLGVDLAGLLTLADLQSGVRYALRQIQGQPVLH